VTDSRPFRTCSSAAAARHAPSAARYWTGTPAPRVRVGAADLRRQRRPRHRERREHVLRRLCERDPHALRRQEQAVRFLVTSAFTTLTTPLSPDTTCVSARARSTRHSSSPPCTGHRRAAVPIPGCVARRGTQRGKLRRRLRAVLCVPGPPMRGALTELGVDNNQCGLQAYGSTVSICPATLVRLANHPVRRAGTSACGTSGRGR
jgi:hypothetical protein